MHNHLFSQTQMYDVGQAVEARLREDVDGIPEAQLLNTNPDELATYFAEKHGLDLPQLREADITVSDHEAQKDVSKDFDRLIRDRSQPVFVPATAFLFFVPFDGEGQYFRCQGSLISYNPPRATLDGNQLIFTYVRTDTDATAVRIEFERDLSQVKQLLADVAAHGQQINARLKGLALTHINARRDRLMKGKSAAAALGYPVRRREGATQSYAVPQVKRKLAPAMPATSRDASPEPALDAANYEHILSVISSMVRVIEQSPAAFAEMGEEDLRQQILVQLNGQYEGQATGETFNFEGKTDILIRVNGKNIFIAECKFWEGPKGFDSAVDQLLGYLTWRDTKAAIVLFNRGRALSTVLEKIPGVMKTRLELVREEAQSEPTRFRYVIHHRDDPQREITLTILVFEVPKPSTA